MADITVNDAPVISGVISRPRVGAWHARLDVLSTTAITGSVTIRTADGRLSLVGTAVDSGVFVDRARLRVIGGAGGLAKDLGAQFYHGVPVRLVLGDILRECGETLSTTSDQATLAKTLSKWTRTAGPAGHALTALLDEVPNAAWRVLADGTIWVGPETWPPAKLADEPLVLESDIDDARVLIACEDLSLAPGTTLFGQRISSVVHQIDQSKTRTEILVERSGSKGDRFKGAIEAIIRRILAPKIDYLAAYPGRVVSQAADGKLDIVLDTDRIKGLTGVPIRYGVPGVAAKVAKDARVIVQFENGNPKFPVATLWEGAGLTELVITATTKVSVNSPNVFLAEGDVPIARQGDMVAVALPILIGTTKYSPIGHDPTATGIGVIVSGSQKSRSG